MKADADIVRACIAIVVVIAAGVALYGWINGF
jgi:uncharacterized protein HemX